MSLPSPDTRHAAWLLAVGTERDRAAFVALFHEFAPRMKAWLMRAGVPAEAAEDAAQEAMLAVWQKAAQFDPARATASAWMFTILRNRYIDQTRRGLRRPPIDVLPPPDSEPASQDTLLLAEERSARLHTALSALPNDQRAALELAFFKSCSHSEMGKVLGLPLGTVKSRLRLAMAKLRSALAEDDMTP